MKKLITAALAAILLSASSASAQPVDPVRVALGKAHRWLHHWPSCRPVEVQFGALPVGWGMAALEPACLIRVSSQYYSPAVMEHLENQDGDYYITVWQVFCADIVAEVATLDGTSYPEDYNYEYLYTFCGSTA
jgi:hypothetical protein